jgi:hypothetical protein
MIIAPDSGNLMLPRQSVQTYTRTDSKSPKSAFAALFYHTAANARFLSEEKIIIR